MHAKLFFALALLPVCLAAPKHPADLQVTAIRFWTLSDVTRVAIEANGEFTYKWDRLSGPDRLFFDLAARPNLTGKRFATLPVNDKLLKQIRVAENTIGRTRVVLDLAGYADFHVTQLGNPDRLIIELSAKDRPSAPETPATSEVTANPPAPVPDATAPGESSPATVPASPESAKAAKRTTSDGSSSMIRALGLKVNRIVIDPGHGGHDVGTTGVTGLLEKDLVLDVALRLGKLIEQKMGAEVIYTRSDDAYVPLEERTVIANRSHADLFISVHANSSPAPAVAGVETFYLNFTSSSDALDVASRENASSKKSVFELRDLIQSISLHDKIEESREFANDVQQAMQANAIRFIPTARDRGIKKAPFVVLIGAQMPSILSEIGFVTNAREEALMRRSDHRQRIAEALFKGLSRYADSLSHVQVTGAKPPPAPVAAKADRDGATSSGATAK